jgi:hypothetical protein
MADAYYYRGHTIEIDLSVSKATIEGNEVKNDVDLSKLFGLPPSPSKTDAVKSHCQQCIDKSKAFRKRKTARREHLEVLKKGVTAWNEWRQENPTVRPLFYNRNLTKSALGTTLDGVNFANAVLINTDLRGQDLNNANFHEANLGGAKLHGAKLRGANFCRTDLYETEMIGADLNGANLQGAQLAKTDITGAHLIGCKVYGMSAWDLRGDPAEQKDLKILYRPAGDGPNHEGNVETAEIDDLQVAQFMYMLLNNENVKTVIDATTSRIVLILGRFTPQERKDVLDKIRKALRDDHHLVPILFDFVPSENRDLTETIQLVANLASFVIADLSDAKSIPQELSHIVPNLPSLPIQPILCAPQQEYSMFEHWRRYPWVLPEFLYESSDHLITNLQEKVIQPARTRLEWMSPQASLRAAKLEIERLKKRLAKLQEGSPAATTS